MKKEISDTLKQIEKQNNVRIVWAIESGSRAWGFASEDSDYDVRCMHVGELENYLGLYPPPQQINVFKNNIDVESWDIKKFAALFMKSNPQIAEWLRSTIAHKESPVRKQMRDLFDNGCSLEFLRQHYVRMAKQNYKKYLGLGSEHSCKKYLYVLRGLACALFIEKENKLPPLPYKQVIPYLPEYAQDFFERCVIKKNKTEKAAIVANENVSAFIDKMLSQQFPRTEQRSSKASELNSYVVNAIKKFGYRMPSSNRGITND